MGKTAAFVWFSNLFKLCKSLHETALKILLSAYWLFFSHISVLEIKNDWLSQLKVLDSRSCGRLNKQLASVFLNCWLNRWNISQAAPVKQRILIQVCRKISMFFISELSIAMRILSREHFKRGILFNAIFQCELMFIGIVILQVWPNEGISQSKISQSSTYFHKILSWKQLTLLNLVHINRRYYRATQRYEISLPSDHVIIFLL